MVLAKVKSGLMTLIDTPGFNDTNTDRSEEKIVNESKRDIQDTYMVSSAEKSKF